MSPLACSAPLVLARALRVISGRRLTLTFSTKDAKRFLEQYGRRLDHAIDAFYNQPPTGRREPAGPSTTKLNQLFENYKGAPCPMHGVIAD